MKKIILSILFVAVLKLISAQCNYTKTKILIVGDSWAFFSWQDNSYNENLERFGFTDIEAESTLDISVSGTRASNYFNDNTRKQAVKNFIQTHLDLEYIHLSLGGNDLLGEWNKSMTSAQETALLNQLMFDLKKSIDTIHSFNPNLKILVAGYDFPNFAETVEILSPSWVQQNHPFYSLWNGMGKPSPTELNAVQIKGTQAFIDSANVWNNVYFVNNLGLMQWHFGQSDNLQVAPFGTYAVQTAPVPGGFPDYPSPLDALNFNGLDAFHLNNEAYEVFIKRHFEEFYWNRLRNAEQTIFSDSIISKSLTANNINNEFHLGKVGTNNSKILLSFNTSNLQDDYISKASIFLQRKNLSGPNIAAEQLILEISYNYFGSSIQVELEDYNVIAIDSAEVCTYGTLSENGFWYRIDLPSSFFKYINTTGSTQFSLSFPNITESDRYLSFETKNSFVDFKFGGNLYEQYNPIIVCPTNLIGEINIFPNPSSDFINIHLKDKVINELILKNVNGQKVNYTWNNKKQTIDISNLEKGIYFVQVISENKKYISKIIKQ